jgi:hypothetical protein
MRVATVDSTTLATVAYDETQELLRLEFCSRAVYLYFGVPATVHQALRGAFQGQVFQSGDSRAVPLPSDSGLR